MIQEWIIDYWTRVILIYQWMVSWATHQASFELATGSKLADWHKTTRFFSSFRIGNHLESTVASGNKSYKSSFCIQMTKVCIRDQMHFHRSILPIQVLCNAIENDHSDVVQQLLSDARVDPSGLENNGTIRFLVSQSRHHSEVVKLLLNDARLNSKRSKFSENG